MASCRTCTAEIIWAVDQEGIRVPLDAHEQLDYGTDRYRIIRDGTPPLVAEVPDNSSVRTFVDHRHLCQQARAI